MHKVNLNITLFCSNIHHNNHNNYYTFQYATFKTLEMGLARDHATSYIHCQGGHLVRYNQASAEQVDFDGHTCPLCVFRRIKAVTVYRLTLCKSLHYYWSRVLKET